MNVRVTGRSYLLLATICATLIVIVGSRLIAQDAHFHDAPAASAQLKNPFAGQDAAVATGANLYATNCASCHGAGGQGTGNIPPLTEGPTQIVPDGEIFWFITTGSVKNGMPPWGGLPEEQRWQIVSFVKSLKNATSANKTAAPPANFSATTTNAAPPAAPFTDFRFEEPGKLRKITAESLPAPYATDTSNNGPKLVARPDDAWPQAPPGFKVQLYATGLDNPRLIRTAPNGDFFLAESSSGNITVLRGIRADGKAKEIGVFATGLNRPYGIAFYPPGDNPQWVYIGNTDSVVRFPYKSGDLRHTGPAEHLADLAARRGALDPRRAILRRRQEDVRVSRFSIECRRHGHYPRRKRIEPTYWSSIPTVPTCSVYAYGIRNAGGGLAIHPTTRGLWCSVNERDGLGDNLVPDYITHVEEGGFYGWPWWYIGAHQDPRHEGKHPELKDKVLVPDVLLQPHNASLEMIFYEGSQFPAEYKGDIFASEHGSWNRSVRTGYEVIRVPMHQTGRSSGEYEDFVSGFVVDNGHVWGRPVGITVAPDGSLLLTDDGSNSVWRISYVGK